MAPQLPTPVTLGAPPDGLAESAARHFHTGIWVRGLVAGDVMVDRSIRGDRLRPLGLFGTAARGRVSQHFWELAGSLGVIED